MGGGKKSKHKNLYKGQRKPDTGVNACGKVPKTLDYADFEKGCTANQASFENANVTVKSEVTYVADSDEELMETTKCDEKDITEADSFEVKKDDENLSVTMEDTKKIKSNPDGGDRGKGKKQTHYRDFSPKVHSEPNQYSHPNKNNRSCGGRNDRKDNEYQTKSYGNQNDRHDRKSRQSDNVSYSDCKQLDKTENFKKERMDTSQWDDDDATFSIEITEDSESSSVVENEEKKAKDDTEKEHFKDDSDKRRDPGRKQRWGKVGEPPTIEETKNKWDFYSNPHQESNRSQQFSGSAQSTHYRNKSGDRKNYQGDDRRSYGRGYGEGKSGRYRADSFGSKDRGSTSRSKDLDYVHWNKNLRYSPKEEGTNVNERFGDLFCASDEYSLAHCVAEDMNMGSGIATTFRSVFKRVYELLQQRVTQGGVAVLHVDGRYIYYLVTKRQSSGKPTYERLFRSLCAMRKHIEENDVTKLAMPRIGCGLDGLEWREVKSMLQYIFYGVNVDIVIYNFQQNHGKTKQKLQTRKSGSTEMLTKKKKKSKR